MTRNDSGHVEYKYSLLMHGIKFESFAKFIFDWKNPFMCGFISLKYMYFIYVSGFMYRRGFIIVQSFRPWLRHNGLQNLIRVLHSSSVQFSSGWYWTQALLSLYIQIGGKISLYSDNQSSGFQPLLRSL